MPARLQAFLAVLVWGVSFVATKAAVAEISPVALICARAGLGAVLLLAVMAARGESLLLPRDSLAMLLAMGFVGVAFHQLLQAYALTMTSAVNTGWLIGITPIWSALLAVVALRERLSAGRIAGLLLGFLGAGIVVTRGRLSGALALPSTRGDLLILLSTLNWAFYTVLGHSTIRRLGPTRATAGSILGGVLWLTPLFLLFGAWRDFARLSATGWLAVLFLGLLCSGAGYLFWYGALARVDASRVAAFLYLEPLVTLGAAALLLGETIGVATLAGGALLVAGVVLVQRA
jgi:drug/metabolite transporter (DMT)-like permease